MDDYEDQEPSPYDGTYSEGGDAFVPEDDDIEEEMAEYSPSNVQEVICPHCGGKDLLLLYFADGINEYRVQCRNPICGGEFGLGDLPDWKE